MIVAEQRPDAHAHAAAARAEALVDAEACREGPEVGDDLLAQPILVVAAITVMCPDLAVSDAEIDAIGNAVAEQPAEFRLVEAVLPSLKRAICSNVRRTRSATGTLVFT